MNQWNIEEVQVGDRKIFIETYCTVEDRWLGIGVDGVGLIGWHTFGGEVNIWNNKPDSRDKPSPFEQFLCSLFWFVCIPVSAFWNWWRGRDRWTVTGSVQIKIENFYFANTGQSLGNEGKTCTQSNSCDLYQYRPEAGAVGFPPFTGGVVDGVRTIATVFIGGREHRHDVWQSDSGNVPPAAP